MNLKDLLVKFLVWRLKHISNNNFILIMSGIVGLVSGFAAVTLKSAVHFIQHLLSDYKENSGFSFLYMIYPVIGIILTVLISKYIFKSTHIGGHGITKILYYISKRSSVVKRTLTYTRMVTSAITVGFGGSVGLEAPIVVTGSAIGSNLGRLTHMNYKKRTLLIACGASGAISAIFNSPIAGVIFAIEVILTDVTINKFIPILISSVVGSMVSYSLLGRELLFSFKLNEAFKPEHIHYYILLGIACGIISVHFTRLTYLVENSIEKIKNDMNRALLGGVGLAIIILAFPPIYGEGYNIILNLLNGNDSVIFDESMIYGETDQTMLVIVLLFAILVIKPVASALTIGAGGSGGIFAPSLFMGGIGGYLFSRTINYILPVQIDTSHFTLVGMCGVMSGVLHAPLTAIFLIAEITGGYELFVPLMLVSAISFTTINYFEPYSLYTKPLIEKGDLIQHDKDRQVLSQMKMRKLIESDLLSIKYDASLDDLIDLVKISKRNIFPVLNYEGGLEGIVTLDDIREKMFDPEKRSQIIVKQVMQLPPAEVDPKDSMEEVMNKFEVTQAWNLPVIENGKYLGFLSKSRIFNAYRNRLISTDKE